MERKTDKRYDIQWIFLQTMMALPGKPIILIEIKGTNEHFIIFGAASLLRGSLASAGSKEVLKAGDHLFENRSSLGEVIVKYDGNKITFPDYNAFLEHIT